MPLISIIMPAHNMAPWIRATLKSVQAQTMRDWECIVVDDGSTDDTDVYVSAMDDARFQLIQQKKGGVSLARNRGLDAAQGKYIVFLDADDLWHPMALERMIHPMQCNNKVDVVWANFLRFDDSTQRIIPQPATRLQHTGNTWYDMLVDNFIPFGAVCVRSALAKQHMFDIHLTIGEDRDWLLRVLRHAVVEHVPHIVHYYRQRSGSAIRNISRFLEDENALMQRHLADASIPSHIRKRSLSALAFHAAVLRAKEGSIQDALRLYCKAIALDPLYLETYLRPLRKAWFRVLPKKYLSQGHGVV